MPMLNYANYAITLGRAVELFRQGPEAVPEQKMVLRALAGLARLAAVTVTVGDRELRIGGAPVPTTLPGILTLWERLAGHDVSELSIQRGASPASLLRLLRGLAAIPGGNDLAAQLRTAGISDVGVRLRTGTPPQPPSVPPPVPVPPADAAPQVHSLGSRLSPSESAVAAIALDPEARDVGDRLIEAVTQIRADLEQGRPSAAVRALGQLIDLEGGFAPGTAQETLRGAIDPLMTRETFRGALDCAGEGVPEHTRDAAIRILHRGGPAATAVLRDQLFTERDEPAARMILALLRGQPDGLRSLILLLQHADRQIVCRAAGLIGTLGIREAVPALARVVRHSDHGIQIAVTGALVQLATPDATETLGAVLQEADVHRLSALADVLRGPALGPLVRSLDQAARRVQDPHALSAIGAAIGRIGTPEAVRTLARWAERPGWRFWRRRGAVRLAAVDGLRIAGGPGAVGLLEELSRDRDPAIRRAATEAVEDLSIAT